MATQTTPVSVAASQCIVCGGDDWRPVRRGCDLYQPGDDTMFQLDRCLACGIVMQNPPPTAEQLSKGYSAEYAPFRPAWKQRGWPLWKVLRELTTYRRLRRLARYGSGNTMLEVGCGAGDFLVGAQRKGWQVCAVEYSDSLAAELRHELHLDVRAGDLKPGLWPEATFDAVILWSVLEHLHNPLEALRTASSYLKPGGAVFIQIPTVYGVEQGLGFGEYWALLDLPRHLSFFGRDTLSYLCDQAGMTVTVFKTPLLEAAWCSFASIGNYAGRSKSPTGAFWLTLRSILSFPGIALRAWRGHGTEAFAVAVKR